MRHTLEQVLLHLVVVSMVFVYGCSDDSEGVNPEDRLCRGESGFAAMINGGPQPVEMCVSDEQTIAHYVTDPGGDRYAISATFTSDSLTIEIQIGFFVQPNIPRTLTLTADEGVANADPSAAWFFYTETKLNTYNYVSTSVSGTFTVTFNDPSIATVSFSGVSIALDDASSGDPAGARTISEGYLSVNAD